MRKMKTHQEFLDELFNVNPRIKVLEEYNGANNSILVECIVHNYQYYATPHNLLYGKGCKFCKGDSIREKKRKDFDEIRNEFENRGYVLLSTKDEIKSPVTDKLRYLCPKHGEQSILWGNFQQGKGCPYCANETHGLIERQKTWDKIIQRFESSEYKLLSTFEEYTGNKESCLRCLCEKHGEFRISWTNFQKFEGCPICNSSMGERRVYSYLKTNNIMFEHPYSFDNLLGLGGKKLSYDFYVPDYNLLIEYQGEQHEKPLQFHGIDVDTALNNFIKQKEHDTRKREYALKNNYKLLEIWYYDFKNIENILNKITTIQNE